MEHKCNPTISWSLRTSHAFFVCCVSYVVTLGHGPSEKVLHLKHNWPDLLKSSFEVDTLTLDSRVKNYLLNWNIALA